MKFSKQQNKYQERSSCSEPQRLVAAEISITKESSNHSTKVCGAIKDIDNCSSCYALHVEDRSQIDQEIG